MHLRPSLGLFWLGLVACAGSGAGSPAPARGTPAVTAANLPVDDQIPGWRGAEAGKRFAASDLYNHIDGGAEQFLELGFEEVRVQSYRRGADELTVELYRMRDEIAALAAFLANQGEPRRDPALEANLRIGRHQLVFQKHRYYVLITNPDGKPALAPAMLDFARAIAAQLPTSAPTPLLSLLPAAGRVAGSLRLFRGRTGLESIYTLGAGDILLLGGEITAVAANYQDPSGTVVTRMVVPYPSPEAAEAAFRNLVGNLDSYLQVIEKQADRLLFRDYDGKWGEAIVRGARLEIRVRLELGPSGFRTRASVPAPELEQRPRPQDAE